MSELKYRRWECCEGTSSKFWEISRCGRTYAVRFGRIGLDPRSYTRELSSEQEAEAKLLRLVDEKQKKGYREIFAVVPHRRLHAGSWPLSKQLLNLLSKVNQ